MKTNRELNTEYDRKQAESIRPKAVQYEYSLLESIVRSWVKPVEEVYSPYLGM